MFIGQYKLGLLVGKNCDLVDLGCSSSLVPDVPWDKLL